jgi:hypothetical protein
MRSLFYEYLEEYISTSLASFPIVKKGRPIENRPGLEVDYVFDAKRPLFVFGIKDGAKARLATIACLEVEKGAIPFRSLAVHEDFEALSPTDRSLITNSMDKQFTDLDDFKSRAVTYFNREIAYRLLTQPPLLPDPRDRLLDALLHELYELLVSLHDLPLGLDAGDDSLLDGERGEGDIELFQNIRFQLQSSMSRSCDLASQTVVIASQNHTQKNPLEAKKVVPLEARFLSERKAWSLPESAARGLTPV